jgi:hypothetical protein
MEPAGTTLPQPFARVRLDVLRRAIEIYMADAYPSGVIPDAVRRRLEWDPSRGPDELLTHPPFEKVGKTPDGGPIVALRLGNLRYPNMKLQIQPWGGSHGFLLSVNTHDQVLALDPNAPDVDAFRALQAENQRIKQAIENAWDEACVPTFLRYLRDYIASQPR